MDTQEQLYNLIEAAQAQQAAVEQAIKALEAAEYKIDGYGKMLSTASQDLKQHARQTNEAIKTTSQQTIDSAVNRSLSGASEIAAKAMSQSTQPIIGTLTSTLNAIKEAETSLKQSAQWTAWKWIGLAAVGMIGFILVGYVAVGWAIHERADVVAQIEQMQANIADLEKRGGKVKLVTCGDKQRLCVQVNKKLGSYGENADYFILSGY